jgi:arginyl-tRNA--protein-N-Asp/Glu arginylyltransferase
MIRPHSAFRFSAKLRKIEIEHFQKYKRGRIMKRILFRSYHYDEDSVIAEVSEEEFAMLNKYTERELENGTMSDEDSELLNNIYCRGTEVTNKHMYDLPIDLEIPRT